MAVIIRKPIKKYIAFFLLALMGGSVLAGLWLVKQRNLKQSQSYELLAAMPSSFVNSCQKASLQYNVPWELLASVYQVSAEHGLGKQLNEDEDIENIAKAISQSKARNSLNLDTTIIMHSMNVPFSIALEIRARGRLIANKSYLYSGAYSFPYAVAPYYTDTWGADRAGGRKHEGTDLFLPEGTPIYSVCSGKVEKLGWNKLGGERVGIRGNDQIYYYYAHLAEINPDLYTGMKVNRGALLGYTGHTGDAIATPDHLHFGMELPGGKWINPYNFLRYWQVANVLPISK